MEQSSTTSPPPENNCGLTLQRRSWLDSRASLRVPLRGFILSFVAWTSTISSLLSRRLFCAIGNWERSFGGVKVKLTEKREILMWKKKKIRHSDGQTGKSQVCSLNTTAELVWQVTGQCRCRTGPQKEKAHGILDYCSVIIFKEVLLLWCLSILKSGSKWNPTTTHI